MTPPSLSREKLTRPDFGVLASSRAKEVKKEREKESEAIMDPIMELALLQRRFPDVPVSDYGNLVKGIKCLCVCVF